jgi:hypothetical protein
MHLEALIRDGEFPINCSVEGCTKEIDAADIENIIEDK